MFRKPKRWPLAKFSFKANFRNAVLSRSYGRFVPVSPKNCWRVKIEDSHRACGKWLFSQNGGLWLSFPFRKILGMLCFFASMDSLFLFHLKTVKDKRYKIRRICLESQNGCPSFSLWTNEDWRIAEFAEYVLKAKTRRWFLVMFYCQANFRNAMLSRSYGQFVPVSTKKCWRMKI